MLVVLYVAAWVLVISALPTTFWVSLIVGSLVALFIGFAWVTK